MKIKIVSLFIACLLTACSFGKRTVFNPDLDHTECSKAQHIHTKQVSISGWGVVYYLLPIWGGSHDNSDQPLSVEFYFELQEPEESLTKDKILLRVKNKGIEIQPIDIVKTSHVEYESTSFINYRVEFDALLSDFSEFEIVFTEPVHGCNISPISYEKIIKTYNVSEL